MQKGHSAHTIRWLAILHPMNDAFFHLEESFWDPIYGTLKTLRLKNWTRMD